MALKQIAGRLSVLDDLLFIGITYGKGKLNLFYYQG